MESRCRRLRTVCEKNMCAGCMACVDACSQNAIEIKDEICYLNAVIDEEKCVQCNQCHRVCQVQHRPEYRNPIIWREGWSKQEDIRRISSSGGYATAIETAFIQAGGAVCSCAFENGVFGFSIVETMDAIKKFKGSKYVKSNPIGAYKKVARLLKQGKKVLFVALPCQVASMKNFTNDNENLYTIDLICHGTPSVKVLEKFLHEYDCSLRQLNNIVFRTKNRFNLKNGEKTFTVSTVRDNYIATFLNGTTYTENCYKCEYARLERVSDLTLGDSWGSKCSYEEIQKGISLVLCQTSKGEHLLEMADLYIKEVDLDNAVLNNHQLYSPSDKPKQRENFLRMLKKGYKYSYIVMRCYPIRYMKDVAKTLLFKVRRGG